MLRINFVAHIIFCSKDNKDSLRKYNIWLPLFIIYLIYPLIVIAFGDVRVGRFFNAFIPYKEDGVIYAPEIVLKFSALFLTGLFSLFMIRTVLLVRNRHNFTKVLKRILAAAAITVAILLIYIGGPKRLLIPYNILAPFVGILASFLGPIKNVLLMDSSRSHYFIPLQTSVFNFLLSFLVVFLFIKSFVLKNKKLLILIVFYMASIIYLYLWNPVTSRYFVYISPTFCIIFCSVFEYLYTGMTKRLKLAATVKTLILILIFTGICVPNIFAIKLALVSGKMANTFATYDYIRMANIAKEDITRKNAVNEVKRNGICINNIIPVVSSHEHILPSDIHNDNVKFIFKQVFNDPFMDIEVNFLPERGRAIMTYVQDGYRVKDKEGLNADLFSRLLEEALSNLRQKNYADAEMLFKRAVEKRPYLLNYILPDLKLEDICYVTNGRDMRAWINKIGSFNILYSPGTNNRFIDRNKYISGLMNNEINEYIQCLFYVSFLKNISGNREESKYWFSKIQFLESNYNNLSLLLSQVSLAKENKEMLAFLDSLDPASLYTRPDNYSDRFKFEKFLFRLMFG